MCNVTRWFSSLELVLYDKRDTPGVQFDAAEVTGTCNIGSILFW